MPAPGTRQRRNVLSSPAGARASWPEMRAPADTPTWMTTPVGGFCTELDTHTLAASHMINVVDLAMQRVQRWAGHVARLHHTAPAALALRCRNIQWWRWRQDEHKGTKQIAGARGVHPRRYRICRWEEQVSSQFGEGYAEDTFLNTGWLAKAQSKQWWHLATRTPSEVSRRQA